jgi:F-type H+-transporting ATPase subunit epsilon
MPPEHTDWMHLTVNLPTERIVNERAVHIAAEGPEGHFTLLPRHIDFVSLIVPGILSYQSQDDGRDRYLGVDEGVLVKCGSRVRVALRDAVAGDNLEELRGIVERRFVELDEESRQARSALARLEAGAVRRFVEMEKR